MDEISKVIIALGFFVTVAYSINAIARGVLAVRKQEKEKQIGGESVPADARLARIEQAVDAIALEIERISEGQRFTTRLLSEQSHRLPQSEPPRLSSNTPH